MSSLDVNKGIPRSRIAECFPDAPKDIEERIALYGQQRGLGEYWQQEDIGSLGKIIYNNNAPVLYLPPVGEVALHLPPVEPCLRAGMGAKEASPADVVEAARVQIAQVKAQMKAQLEESRKETAASIARRSTELRLFNNKCASHLEGILQYADFLKENGTPLEPSWEWNGGVASVRDITPSSCTKYEGIVKSVAIAAGGLKVVVERESSNPPWDTFMYIGTVGGATMGMAILAARGAFGESSYVSGFLTASTTFGAFWYPLGSIPYALVKKWRNPELSWRDCLNRYWVNYSVLVNDFELKSHTDLPAEEVRSKALVALEAATQYLQDKVRELPEKLK